MKNFFELIGRYFMLMSKAFSRPEKFSIYRKRILVENFSGREKALLISMK